MAEENSGKDIWKKELWTQREVASYFRVVQGTVKNWRDRGLLSYWQAPGSTRVLYYRDEVRDFRDNYTKAKKGGGNQPDKPIVKRKPVVSSKTDEDWRI